MSKVVDVAIETVEGDLYQFPSVLEEVLRAAVDKAISDRLTLSVVNLASAALVIFWPTISRITFSDASIESADDAWELLWEAPEYA